MLVRQPSAYFVTTTPWSCHGEFLQVYKQQYDFNAPDQQRQALETICSWRLRNGNLPLSVDITSSQVQLHLSQIDSASLSEMEEMLSESRWRLEYGMIFIRFVNGLMDVAQKRATATSLNKLAEDFGLPRMFVDMRHEASHNDLPSLLVMRLAAGKALSWLLESYWQPHADAGQEVPSQIRNILKEFKKKYKIDQRLPYLEKLQQELPNAYSRTANSTNNNSSVLDYSLNDSISSSSNDLTVDIVDLPVTTTDTVESLTNSDELSSSNTKKFKVDDIKTNNSEQVHLPLFSSHQQYICTSSSYSSQHATPSTTLLPSYLHDVLLSKDICVQKESLFRSLVLRPCSASSPFVTAHYDHQFFNASYRASLFRTLKTATTVLSETLEGDARVSLVDTDLRGAEVPLPGIAEVAVFVGKTQVSFPQIDAHALQAFPDVAAEIEQSDGEQHDNRIPSYCVAGSTNQQIDSLVACLSLNHVERVSFSLRAALLALRVTQIRNYAHSMNVKMDLSSDNMITRFYALPPLVLQPQTKDAFARLVYQQNHAFQVAPTGLDSLLRCLRLPKQNALLLPPIESPASLQTASSIVCTTIQQLLTLFDKRKTSECSGGLTCDFKCLSNFQITSCLFLSKMLPRVMLHKSLLLRVPAKANSLEITAAAVGSVMKQHLKIWGVLLAALITHCRGFAFGFLYSAAKAQAELDRGVDSDVDDSSSNNDEQDEGAGMEEAEIDASCTSFSSTLASSNEEGWRKVVLLEWQVFVFKCLHSEVYVIDEADHSDSSYASRFQTILASGLPSSQHEPQQRQLFQQQQAHMERYKQVKKEITEKTDNSQTSGDALVVLAVLATLRSETQALLQARLPWLSEVLQHVHSKSLEGSMNDPRLLHYALEGEIVGTIAPSSEETTMAEFHYQE